MDNTELIIELFTKHKTYDPFELCALLNIEISYVNFNKKPLGQAVIDPLFDNPLILLDNSLIGNSYGFFVCAHELCHVLKHEKLSIYYVSNKFTKAKLGVESNYFAVKLATLALEKDYGSPLDSFEQLNHSYGVPLNFINYYF